VDQGTLAATVVSLSLTTTQIALEMPVRAIRDGAPPPLRTLIDLNSYPPLERLSAKGREKNGGGEMSSVGPGKFLVTKEFP
jgi:hypothetical protein